MKVPCGSFKNRKLFYINLIILQKQKLKWGKMSNIQKPHLPPESTHTSESSLTL